MSIIKWIGGKDRIAKKIVALFPKHKTYCEPFFGSGAVFFAKKPSKIEVINDIDGRIVNLFTVIRDKKDEFLEYSKYELYSRENYYKYVETLDKGSDVERAVKFFWVINQTIKGDLLAKSWLTGPNKNYAKEVQNKLGKIDLIHKRLKNTIIDNRDFEKIIKLYDSPETLFFLDPPYIKNNLYYKTGFDLRDHLRLRNCLKEIKGKFIMTIDDTPFIREKYSDFNIINNPIRRQSNQQKVNDLIITNFRRL